MGPKTPRSTVLSQGEEAIVVAFRKHTLLPLGDCLYAMQASIPHLTRSALHRCLQRHGISRLPEIEGEKPSKKKFKTYPIGFVHIDIAELRTEEGELFLFIAIDRTSKLAFARLVEKANSRPVPQRAGRSSPLQDRCRADRQRHPVRRSAEEPQRSNRNAARPSV